MNICITDQLLSFTWDKIQGSEYAQPHHRQNFSPSTETRKLPIFAKMLYFIGLGLADEKDITVKGLEIVQKAERVYLEAYTAVLLVEKDKLVIPPF
jgi:hypothetical protein